MKKFIYHIPVVLLISYIILCFVRPPQIADSIIVLSIASLYGFLMYVKAFREVETMPESNNIKELKNRLEELRLQREATNYQLDIAKLATIERGVTTNGKKTFNF